MLIITDRIIDVLRKTIEMKYEEALNNSDKILKKENSQREYMRIQSVKTLIVLIQNYLYL